MYENSILDNECLAKSLSNGTKKIRQKFIELNKVENNFVKEDIFYF